MPTERYRWPWSRGGITGDADDAADAADAAAANAHFRLNTLMQLRDACHASLLKLPCPSRCCCSPRFAGQPEQPLPVIFGANLDLYCWLALRLCVTVV